MMSSCASASLCVISFWACPGASSGRKRRALLVMYYSSPVHRHRSALDHEVGGSRHAGSGNRAELHNCKPQPCYVAAIGQSVGKGMGADRKSVVWGKSVSVRLDIGGRRVVKKK